MNVYCFDVHSHSKMHLPFNESYIQIVRSAFPNDQIYFYAEAGHIDNLKIKFTTDSKVTFGTINPMVIPFGFSRHNPLLARIGANKTLNDISKIIKDKEVRLVTLMGADSGLYSAVADSWKNISNATIHLLMHAQLGDAMVWRSRNPFIKMGDYVSQLNKKLSANVKIVALELGVKESIIKLAPHLENNIITLEHPVVPAECSNNLGRMHQKIRVGFLGHANRNKGFDIFCNIAKKCTNSNIEFHAIGIEAKTEAQPIDTSGLTRKPAKGGLSRREYITAIQEVDIVCSPMYNRCYDFIASGTVSDAITHLRPIIGLSNITLEAIQKKYGQYGHLFNSAEDMLKFFNKLTIEMLASLNTDWHENLLKIQQRRHPINLGKEFAKLPH